MLTREDNELLTRVGPETPMGTLLRRFWFPACLAEEVAEPDGPPIRLRLLGEDLIAFRDTNGSVGIVGAHCPHRRAGLFFGRNEEGGIRCVYHGWKFATDGQCLERPCEPNDSEATRANVRLKSYPTMEAGAAVWVYMGPPDLRPPFPAFEWARLAPGQRTLIKRLQHCNWAQAVEGGVDSSHISFLHSKTEAQLARDPSVNNPLHAADRHPTFEVEQTEYGLMIAARREASAEDYYWRVTQFLAPFWTMIPPVGTFKDSSEAAYDGHAWVPIDDETTWTWSFAANPHRDFTEQERLRRGGHDGMWGPVDEQFHPLLNKDNDYRIDREAQRQNSFTGISGIPNQDAAVQESMGAISDRSSELLGGSDRGVVMFRRLMLRLAKDLAEGREPDCARNAAAYAVRSASVILPKSTPLRKGAAPLMRSS
jgi:phenylpropionate dioxygenase-like ring-hydroxylating dioxygenase large terminal subunit